MKKLNLLCAVAVFSTALAAVANEPVQKHPAIGLSASAPDGSISIRLVGKRQNYNPRGENNCPSILSPKSVHLTPDGSKYYVNSLEGGLTVVFDAATDTVIKVISHRIGARHANLWANARPDLYPFTHYEKSNNFMGKPVESAFSHNGRYLWVPYYRRSYDINAQDPSACAVIDTEGDSIIRLFETGPLPKMITASPDGRWIAISHWGDNTVGIIDIDSDNPTHWHHERLMTVDYKLTLDFPLDRPVDRDTGSGYALRGTVFTDDSRHLLVGCMGGGGGIAVFNMDEGRYLGRVLGMMPNVRHLLIHGDSLYLSINRTGYVQRCRLSDLVSAADSMAPARTTNFTAWENAKVGVGARTIEISPSGRFVFAACNTDSKICIVDTRTMRQVCEIEADSYPVGLELSEDGSRLYSTSQAKYEGHGGNAVDIYEITYAIPEVTEAEEPEAVAPEENGDEAAAETKLEKDDRRWILALAGVALFAVLATVLRKKLK